MPHTHARSQYVLSLLLLLFILLLLFYAFNFLLLFFLWIISCSPFPFIAFSTYIQSGCCCISFNCQPMKASDPPVHCAPCRGQLMIIGSSEFLNVPLCCSQQQRAATGTGRNSGNTRIPSEEFTWLHKKAFSLFSFV